MTEYEIAEAKPGKAHYTAYGAARDFINYRGPEAIISGPAEGSYVLLIPRIMSGNIKAGSMSALRPGKRPFSC